MNFRTIVSTLFFTLIGTTSLQAAPITVPSGLSPGDQYRLAFVTSSEHDPTSSDIADYNAFVQAHADAVPELLSLGATWKVIGSTSLVDARDNTGTNPFVSAGVPIFSLNGNLLASDNFDLWDGNLSAQLNVDEHGLLEGPPYAWTGSNPDGTATGSYAFGSEFVTAGNPHATNFLWVTVSPGNPEALPLGVYGMSSVITVTIPEPSSFILLCLAGVGALTRWPLGASHRQKLAKISVRQPTSEDCGSLAHSIQQ